MKYKYTDHVVVSVELTSRDAGTLVDALATAYEHGKSYERSQYQKLIGDIVQAFSNDHGRVRMPELKVSNDE
jgi:hypothetical protein|tara:strand:+ start:386 stop:601 length:216 start_codon:yes stop_codon:yes gene_type:complete